jgi:hypothetical protein
MRALLIAARGACGRLSRFRIAPGRPVVAQRHDTGLADPFVAHLVHVDFNRRNSRDDGSATSGESSLPKANKRRAVKPQGRNFPESTLCGFEV